MVNKHHHHFTSPTRGAGQIDQGLELFRRMKAQGLKILGETDSTDSWWRGWGGWWHIGCNMYIYIYE